MIRITVFLTGLLLANVIYSQEPELILPAANSNKMESMAISHNEKYYASADLDGKIKIWEAATGKLIKNIIRDNIYDIAFTPDDKGLIITDFGDPEIYMMETGKFISLGEHKYCSGLDISPDGKWIAIGSEGSVFFYDGKTYELKNSVAMSQNNEEIKFSNDSKTVAFSESNTIEIWSVDKPVLLHLLKGHESRVIEVSFSKDNTQLLSSGDDKTARLWDLKTGKELMVYKGHDNTVWNTRFHPDGKSIITVSGDNTARLWDKNSGKPLQTIAKANGWIYRLRIAPDGQTYALGDADGVGRLFNAKTNQLINSFQAGKETLYYLDYLKNSKQLLTGTYDPELIRWDVLTGKKELTYGSHNERLTALSLSHDEKNLLVTSRDGVVRKIDVSTGRILFYKKLFNDQWATSADFSPDDEMLVVAGGGYSSMMLDKTGKEEGALDDESSSYESFSKFSPDGKYVMHNDNSTLQVVRLEDNKRILSVSGISMFTEHRFSADGKYVITGGSGKVAIYSSAEGKLERTVDVETNYPKNIEMSGDSKYFFCLNNDKEKLDIWESATGKLIKTIQGVNYASFTMDGAGLMLINMDGTVAFTDISTGGEKRNKITLEEFHQNVEYYIIRNEEILVAKSGDNITLWDLRNGKLLKYLKGNEIAYGRSGNELYVLNDDMVQVYNLPDMKLDYRHFIIGEDDFLVQDDKGRFDGTESARKLLYFVCGNEVIELDQAKDQLWVPELAERIMKKEDINAKTLGELNICGLTPLVETKSSTADSYSFSILPRRGGLGEAVVYVNGIEAKRFTPSQLTKNGNAFELVVRKEEIRNFFVSGKENIVTMKAYTSDNTISSRGLIVKEDKTREAPTPPNLYAVMVGVSDYKGDELDLKYAAKDATDISNAVAAAAKKLLNTDGKEHVFTYNLTTAKEHYLLPEKNSIKKILEDIGEKATANDILFIFFAGHGVMAGDGDKKQFYFLTADASSLSTTAAVKDVGISTAELVEWMKPQHIKAQKRVLIFDACNSGQAINDIAGNELTVRNDDKAQQIKAIDKLNEKSGLFILSASASNQSAYEMGRYSQGLLTYSLLKAIKQQPDILEDGKYLNVSRWFTAAEKTVSDVSKENGARQEPQIVTNTNFNIGLIDGDVIAKIILPQEKPLFAASNFQNSDEAVADDDLELSKQINLQLSDLAARGTDSKIVYVTATNSPDAYTLSGRYTIKGDAVTVSVNIKQNKAIKSKFELSGTKDKLNELAATIADKAAGMVK